MRITTEYDSLRQVMIIIIIKINHHLNKEQFLAQGIVSSNLSLWCLARHVIASSPPVATCRKLSFAPWNSGLGNGDPWVHELHQLQRSMQHLFCCWDVAPHLSAAGRDVGQQAPQLFRAARQMHSLAVTVWAKPHTVASASHEYCNCM